MNAAPLSPHAVEILAAVRLVADMPEDVRAQHTAARWPRDAAPWHAVSFAFKHGNAAITDDELQAKNLAVWFNVAPETVYAVEELRALGALNIALAKLAAPFVRVCNGDGPAIEVPTGYEDTCHTVPKVRPTLIQLTEIGRALLDARAGRLQ